MNNIKNTNNSSNKNINQEIIETKICLENGIVRIKMGKVVDADTIDDILKKFTEISKTLPSKPKILADVRLAPNLYGSVFRKKVAITIKDAFKDPGFEKIAVLGDRMTQRAIMMFIISMMNLKNIKFFQNEEEALKWLKEE